jgi:formylglycine-generating enzyme required for sulfatase activity
MKGLIYLSLPALLAACSSAAAPVVVTLTPAVPTPTVAPIDLSAPMQVGSTILYVDGTSLVAVPSGPFEMGHGTADNPQHTVTLSDYWIYSTEVTNHQYLLCVDQGRCTPPDALDDPDFSDVAGLNQPVVGVSFDQARAYCNFVNADLPTEAQWEKAARGPDSNLYPWGKDAPSCDLLNFNNCLKMSSDVTQFARGRSYYGALNMAGNVFEWVADWYDPLYYKASPPGDPAGPDSGRARVIRSSGYRSNDTQSLTYARSFSSPSDHRRDLGFRCSLSKLDYFAPACSLAPTVAASQLSSIAVDCPNISIDVQTTACRYGGGAVVTFNDDHPQDPNASFGGIVGCTLVTGRPGSFPLGYQCQKSSLAVMSSSCAYSGLTGGECPSHYSLNLDSGLCEWDGSRTQGLNCPTGEFYDPVHHCCLVVSGHIVDFQVCPVGLIFTETVSDHFACLPAASVRTVPPRAVQVNPPVCPGACDMSQVICAQRNLVYCPTTCACLSVGVKCPTH